MVNFVMHGILLVFQSVLKFEIPLNAPRGCNGLFTVFKIRWFHVQGHFVDHSFFIYCITKASFIFKNTLNIFKMVLLLSLSQGIWYLSFISTHPLPLPRNTVALFHEIVIISKFHSRQFQFTKILCSLDHSSPISCSSSHRCKRQMPFLHNHQLYQYN